MDGRQIGGTLTASASHAAGQSDTTTVKGEWAAGAHKVEVRFINDLWDGTTTTDRNLYVDGATYNGVAITTAKQAVMGSSTPGQFAFTDVAVSPSPMTLTGTVNADALTGGAAADILTGKAGNDTLTGGAGNDVLKAGSGNDVLSGGDGADWLHGGMGADTMTGGAGPDRYTFGSVEEGGDRITDFAPGDILDLHAMLGHAGSTAAQLATGGYLRAVAVTGGVQIQVDDDGGGNAYETLVTLQGATISGLGTDYVFA